MNFKNFIFISFLLLTGCQQQAIHVIQGHKLLGRYANEMNQSDGLWLSSYGGGFCGEDIQSLSIGLKTADQYFDVAQARYLLVKSIERFIDDINADVDLRPYLRVYPFTINEIEFSLMFLDTHTATFIAKEGYLADAALVGHLVFYNRWDPVKQRLERVHSESYQRACGIVAHQESIANLPPEMEPCEQLK